MHQYISIITDQLKAVDWIITHITISEDGKNGWYRVILCGHKGRIKSFNVGIIIYKVTYCGHV